MRIICKLVTWHFQSNATELIAQLWIWRLFFVTLVRTIWPQLWTQLGKKKLFSNSPATWRHLRLGIWCQSHAALPPATQSHVCKWNLLCLFLHLRGSPAASPSSFFFCNSARWNSCESPRCRIPTPSRFLSPPPRCLLPIKPNAWVIPNKSHSVTSATCWCSSLTSSVWPFLATDGNAGERKDWWLQKKKKNFWPPLTLVWREVSVTAGCCVGSKRKSISWLILNGRFLSSTCLYWSTKAAAAATTQDVEWMQR